MSSPGARTRGDLQGWECAPDLRDTRFGLEDPVQGPAPPGRSCRARGEHRGAASRPSPGVRAPRGRGRSLSSGRRINAAGTPPYLPRASPGPGESLSRPRRAPKGKSRGWERPEEAGGVGRTGGEVGAEAGIGWERSPAALPARGAHLQPGRQGRAEPLVPQLAGRMRKVEGSIPSPAPGQGKRGPGRDWERLPRRCRTGSMTGKTASGAAQTAELRGGFQCAFCGEQVLTEEGFGRLERDRGGDSSSDTWDRRSRAVPVRIQPGSATAPSSPHGASCARLRTGNSGPRQGHTGISESIWEFFNLRGHKAGAGVTV